MQTQEGYFEHPDGGPSAVKLTLHGVHLTSTFGRPGNLHGYRHQAFSDPDKAVVGLNAAARRLLSRGYVPGRHNPAFVEAIRKDPNDVNLYLVYADWLSEVGDPRGELIRTQVALSKSPDDAKLKATESRLLAEFRIQLQGPHWSAWMRPVWRYGFVHAVSSWSSYSRGRWPRWEVDTVPNRHFEFRAGRSRWHQLNSVIKHPSGALVREWFQHWSNPRAGQTERFSITIQGDEDPRFLLRPIR